MADEQGGNKGGTNKADLEEADKVVLIFRGELCHHAHIQQHQLGRCVHLSFSKMVTPQHFDARVEFGVDFKFLSA